MNFVIPSLRGGGGLRKTFSDGGVELKMHNVTHFTIFFLKMSLSIISIISIISRISIISIILKYKAACVSNESPTCRAP